MLTTSDIGAINCDALSLHLFILLFLYLFCSYVHCKTAKNFCSWKKVSSDAEYWDDIFKAWSKYFINNFWLYILSLCSCVYWHLPNILTIVEFLWKMLKLHNLSCSRNMPFFFSFKERGGGNWPFLLYAG